MVRIIDSGRKPVENPYTLARLEDVDLDKLKKKYMESAKNGEIPSDDRSITEIQASEDSVMTAEFIDFFEIEGVDVDPMTDNPLDTMVKISEMMEEGSQELDIAIQSQVELAIEENAAEGIEQIKEFAINDSDPLLQKDFKEKSERIIQKLVIEEQKKEEPLSSGIFESAREESRRASVFNNDPFGSSFSGTRTTTATNTTTVSQSSAKSNTQRSEEYARFVAKGADAMRSAVANGPVMPKPKKTPKAHQFGGKRKISFKGMVSAVKGWFHTEKAAIICKMGVAVCLEAGLAVITKQHSFDSGGQALGYIGMMLGVFYIGSELKASGYDQRRLALI